MECSFFISKQWPHLPPTVQSWGSVLLWAYWGCISENLFPNHASPGIMNGESTERITDWKSNVNRWGLDEQRHLTQACWKYQITEIPQDHLPSPNPKRRDHCQGYWFWILSWRSCYWNNAQQLNGSRNKCPAQRFPHARNQIPAAQAIILPGTELHVLKHSWAAVLGFCLTLTDLINDFADNKTV